jgi:transcriptional regulator with GAF, ATPase, and Fis domain
MDYGKMKKAELVEELKKLQKQMEKFREADAERQRAEEKIQHLNLVLRAIRNVNQLITKEKDRDKLLKGVCENLVEPLGYFNAWGVVLDDSGKLVTSAESGLGRDFRPIRERLERDELTRCGEKALKQSGIVATHNPPSACADCPLSQKYHSRGALTIRLEHGRKVYGLLSASVPAAFAGEKEEHSLFREVANNIAFALHDMELEEECKQMETVLRDREKRYRLHGEDARIHCGANAGERTAFVYGRARH